jgi:hypothetical protein
MLRMIAVQQEPNVVRMLLKAIVQLRSVQEVIQDVMVANAVRSTKDVVLMAAAALITIVAKKMGLTILSCRIVLSEEKVEWKPFRNAVNKKERKEFDEMWDIPRLYISVCSSSVRLVPLHPVVISILFHHYKELKGFVKSCSH